MEYAPELYHYGVKGMKWGVRRNKKTVGTRKNPIRRYNEKKRKRDNEVREGLGEKRYREYRKEYGKKGAGRIYDRVKSKKMSYSKAELRESGRRAVKYYLIETGGYAMITLYAMASLEAIRIRGKRAANAGLLRIAKESVPYKVVADVGDGIEVLSKLK